MADNLQERVEWFTALKHIGQPSATDAELMFNLVGDLWAEIKRLRALAGAVSEGSGDLAKIKADLARDKANAKAHVNPNA